MDLSTKTTFKLRHFQESDIDSLAKYANNPKIAANLTDAFPHPYSVEDAKKFLAMVKEKNPMGIFAIEIDGEVSGAIGIHQQTDIHSKSMECGYWLAEKYWGKGIITEAIKQIVDYGFKTFDIVRIYARPFSFNVPSQRALEKAGFKLEATLKKACFKNGQFCDEMIYSVVK